MSVMNRFPSGAGARMMEGSETLSLRERTYTFRIEGLPVTPKVIYGNVRANSDVYADNHLTAVENENGTAKKLISSANGYATNPTYTVMEKGFEVTGLTPPGVNGYYTATISWKAWG